MTLTNNEIVTICYAMRQLQKNYDKLIPNEEYFGECQPVDSDRLEFLIEEFNVCKKIVVTP